MSESTGIADDYMEPDTKELDGDGQNRDKKQELLDKHGLPLVPQPSSHPSDPLNFKQWLKVLILIEVSIMALLGPFNAAIVNAAYVEIGEHFHISSVTASYQLVGSVAAAGLGSFFFVPLANVYGRRPVYLATSLVTAVTASVSGRVSSWSGLMVARVVNGFFSSSFFTLGAGTVGDVFFLHERGRAMGIFTVCLTNSGHFSPIPGGFIAQFVGYQWCYYFAAILTSFMFIVMFFTLPETMNIHVKNEGVTPTSSSSSDGFDTSDPYFLRPIISRMRLWTPARYRKKLHLLEFARPFKMARYPSVVLPSIYYGFAFTMASILPSAIVAILFNRLYKFKPSQTGLALGVGMLVGSSIGEVFGGPIIDWIVLRVRRRRAERDVPYEVRLQGIWPGAFLVPVGMLIFGLCIHFETPWPGPTIGFAIMSFGIQIISTVVYSYCSDCYRLQTSESAQLLNFARQTLGMTTGFWGVPLGDTIGWQWFGVFLALLSVASFGMILWLMRYGEKYRQRLGEPRWHGM